MNKICYLITDLNIGGAQMMLYRLTKNLDKIGFSPTIISILPFGPLAGRIKAEGIEVYSLNMKSKFDIRVIWRLFKLLKQVKPDILHTHLFHANLLGRVLGKFAGVPIIISSIRNTVFGGKMRENLIRFTDGCAMKTTAICKAASNRMIKQRIVPEGKMQTVYNGLEQGEYNLKFSDEERKKVRKEIGITDNRFFLLAVGRLEEQKGYPVLLKAMQYLKNKNYSCQLAIAGKGSMERELKKLIRGFKIEDDVKFLGIRDDVPELMAAADLFVLSSLWEGLPGVIIEAMASSLPVVSTAVGGAPELVLDQKTGFLVSPDDPEALADAVTKMIELSREEREAMGEAGQEIIKAEFTVGKMVDNYTNLYKECLELNR